MYRLKSALVCVCLCCKRKSTIPEKKTWTILSYLRVEYHSLLDFFFVAFSPILPFNDYKNNRNSNVDNDDNNNESDDVDAYNQRTGLPTG